MRQAQLELERNFDLKAELRKLGGKLEEFGQEADQDYSQHYRWLIPCYMKYVQSSDMNKFQNLIEVHTVSVQKSLILSQTVIDFGEVAVGLEELKEITINNQSSQLVRINMQALPAYCGFAVINYLRSVSKFDDGKGAEDDNQQALEGDYARLVEDASVRPFVNPQKIVIQFKPFEDREFRETLVIVSKTTRVSAQLVGRGVRPEVEISQKDGLLKMGGVIIGESCEKTFKVINVSTFPIKFKVVEKTRGYVMRAPLFPAQLSAMPAGQPHSLASLCTACNACIACYIL